MCRPESTLSKFLCSFVCVYDLDFIKTMSTTHKAFCTQTTPMSIHILFTFIVVLAYRAFIEEWIIAEELELELANPQVFNMAD